MAHYKVEICGINTSKLPLLSNEEKKTLFDKIKKGDKKARETYIHGNLRLVLSIIQRFNNSTENVDDLFQIGCIGLMKAIDNFDVTQNVKFSTYAVPMISGEIRRFLRDDGMIKVSRSLKELAGKVFLVKEELSDCYGRDPTVEEIAGKLGVSSEEVAASLEAGAQVESIYRPLSATEGEKGVLMDKLEEKSEAQEQLLNRLTLEKVMKDLAPQEKELILRRYFYNQTQMETAKALGVSQVQVSRLEKKCLKELRKRFEG